MIANHITDLIGNTPVLRIAPEVHGLANINLYAKLEMMNPFGSVKDRIAWAMLKDELPDIIANNKLVVENSSGNTSKALLGILSTHGIKFKLMSGWAQVEEPKDAIRVMGGEIEELPSTTSNGCFDPNDPDDPQYVMERFITDSNGAVFSPLQFCNEKNVGVHRATTGPEILKDVPDVDIFVGGMGTSGSTRGVIEAVRATRPDVKCFGVYSKMGDYIPGIRDSSQIWEVGLFKRELYQAMLESSALDAVNGMIEVNRSTGLLCGPSAGGQYAAIKQYFTENPATEETNVVFIACDRMEWYLSYIKKYRPDVFDLDADKHGAYTRFYPTEEDMAQCQIAPAELDAWRAAQQPLIIDMRTPTSLKVLRFDGSMNIPEGTLENMLEKNQPFDPKQKVLFICAVGMKSLKAAAFLRTKGVEAYSLEEGIVGYQRHRQPV